MSESEKVRKPKSIAPFVVGNWSDGVFMQSGKQPETPVTERAEIIAWIKQNCPPSEAAYEVIRRESLRVRIGEVKTTSATVEG